MSMTEFFTTVFAGAAATFTGFMCWLIYKQTQTTKELERAWISVEVRHDTEASKHLTNFIGGSAVSLECLIRNRGRTPARLTKCKVVQESLAEGITLPENPDYGTNMKNMDQMLLSPDDTIQEAFHAEADKLSFFERNEGNFYVYGVVYYLDAFGTERYTRFCYISWFPLTSDLLSISELFFRRGSLRAYNKGT
jgi:hypothetical protein